MEGFIIPTEAVLVTINVVSLFTNIPYEEAWEVTLEKKKREESSNLFLNGTGGHLFGGKNRFKEEFFLQIRGVAMGSTFTPSLANSFMSEFVRKYLLNHIMNPFRDQILFFGAL